MRSIISKNPFTSSIRESFKFISNEELEQKLSRAEQAFEIQRKRSIQERASMIKKLGDCIQERFKEASECVTFEMGKPITDAEAEVSKAIRFCKYYS